MVPEKHQQHNQPDNDPAVQQVPITFKEQSKWALCCCGQAFKGTFNNHVMFNTSHPIISNSLLSIRVVLQMPDFAGSETSANFVLICSCRARNSHCKDDIVLHSVHLLMWENQQALI